MNNTIIKRALDGADTILKGGLSPGLTISEIDEAMQEIARIEKRAGESVPQSFVRILCDEQDPRMLKLSQAQQALRDMPATTSAANLITRAENELSDYVKSQQQEGEGVPQAYSRLEKQRDSQFLRYFEYLRQARELL